MTDRQFTLGEGQAPSDAVVEAVATSEDVPSTHLDPPLYDAVDPDALDALFESRATDDGVVSVGFAYGGYAVTVHDRGERVVELIELGGSRTDTTTSEV